MRDICKDRRITLTLMSPEVDQVLQNELLSMKSSHKKERAEDVARIVETEKIKEKDGAIYGKKM